MNKHFTLIFYDKYSKIVASLINKPTVVMEDAKCESLQPHRLWFLAAENTACSIYIVNSLWSIKKGDSSFLFE